MKSLCTAIAVVTLLIVGAIVCPGAPRSETLTPSLRLETSGHQEPNAWRRTANGWELASQWNQPQSPLPTRWTPWASIHPAVVASLMLLLSLLALHCQDATDQGQPNTTQPQEPLSPPTP